MTREKAYKLRELIVKAAAGLADEDAVEGVELFQPWAVDTEYATGDRRRRADRLYKCRQRHRSHTGWEPENAPALLEEIAKPGQGETPDNPIPYNSNMALEEGKYYSQYDVVYVCIRSTINPVYNDLKDLIDIYVKVTE